MADSDEQIARSPRKLSMINDIERNANQLDR
jgi:hypothetical protein